MALGCCVCMVPRSSSVSQTCGCTTKVPSSLRVGFYHFYWLITDPNHCLCAPHFSLLFIDYPLISTPVCGGFCQCGAFPREPLMFTRRHHSLPFRIVYGSTKGFVSYGGFTHVGFPLRTSVSLPTHYPSSLQLPLSPLSPSPVTTFTSSSLSCSPLMSTAVCGGCSCRRRPMLRARAQSDGMIDIIEHAHGRDGTYTPAVHDPEGLLGDAALVPEATAATPTGTWAAAIPCGMSACVLCVRSQGCLCAGCSCERCVWGAGVGMVCAHVCACQCE